jgi:hypothetical protein
MRLRLAASLLLSGCHTVPEASAPAPATAFGLRYEHAFRADDREATFKVFHHLLRPDGTLLTKGPGGTHPHHRGVFLGFNKVQVGDGPTLDFWQCRNGETQRHDGFVPPAELGLAPEWTVAAITWRDAQDRVVLRERRAWRCRAAGADATIVEFVSELFAEHAPLRLGLDPHHAGFHVRVRDEFAAAGGPQVRYLRPPGAVDRGDDTWDGCAWAAAIVPFTEGPVTIVHADAAANPRPNRYSTRPYGRLGSTFATVLQPGVPLRLAYELAIAHGERDAAWCAAIVAE